MALSREIEVHEELAGAAEDLEGLTAECEARATQVERLESLLDAVLDDGDLDVCVVGEDLRIQAISRGFAARQRGGRRVVGRRVEQVADDSWGDLDDLFRSLNDDTWEERPVVGGTLRARRTAPPEGRADGVMYVLRFVGR